MRFNKSKSKGNIVTDGLVLYLDAGIKGSYPGSGTSFTDLASTNDGTITGATYSSANGGLLDFSGTDQYVDCGDTLDDVFAGAGKQFTISAWVKFDDLSTQRFILTKTGDSNHSENNRQFLFYIDPIGGTPRLEVFVYYALTSTIYRGYYASDVAISTGQWYNLVAVYDGTQSEANRFIFYINGSLRSTALNLSAGSEGSIQDGTARLAVGAGIGSASANNPVKELDGQFSMMMIHNRVLSAAEVSQNFEATRNRFGI